MGVIGAVGCVRMDGNELASKLFVHGLYDFCQVERFLEHAARTEQLRDIEKVLIALGAGYGYDLGVKVLASELERGFKPVRVRH